VLTLNQIVSQITNLATAHEQIAESGVGDFAEWQAKERSYPILWVFHESTAVSQMEISFSIRLICADRVIVGEEGDDTQGHEQEVISDTLLVLLDFLAYFQQNHNQPYNVVTSATIDPFTERLNDRLAGNSVTIQIRQPFDWNKCQIPQTGASIPPTVDGLTLYNFCDPAVIARLTPEQVACLEAEYGVTCAGGTVNITNTDSDPIATVTVASGGVEPYVIPNVAWTQSDGSAESTPYGDAIVCTPSTALAVSVALSDTTPEYDQTINVTATATGATSYTFFLPTSAGYDVVTQAGNVYAWTVRALGAFTVKVEATDGVGVGIGQTTGTQSGDVDATAFITAFNTNTGASMDAVQQTAVVNAVQGLKGEGLTFNCTRLWDTLVAGDARWYPYCPIDDSTANALAYQMELFTASAAGTFVGFVGGNFTPNGLTGGAGKYLRTGIAPNAYPQDGIFAASYNRTEAATVNTVLFGSSSTQADFFTGTNNLTGIATGFTNRINGAANAILASHFNWLVAVGVNKQTGVNAIARTTSFNHNGYYDAQTRAIIGNNTSPFSVTPSTREFYVHSHNGTSGENRTTNAQLCGF
jgi:hypothetical protein